MGKKRRRAVKDNSTLEAQRAAGAKPRAAMELTESAKLLEAATQRAAGAARSRAAKELTESAKLVLKATRSLKVGDLAAMLASTASDPESIIERIRHWTREGVLQPIASENAAPGKHRHYDKASAYCAKVLNAMADLGLPVSQSRFLADAMQVVNSEAAKWMTAREKGQPTTTTPLIIGMTMGKAIQVGAGKLRDAHGFKVADAVLKIEVDLAKLFMEVDHVRA